MLCGLGVGLALPTSYLFLHETGTPAHRSILAILNIAMVNLGALFILVLGWVLPYKIVPLLAAVPSLVFCVAIYLMVPESAAYLVQVRISQQSTYVKTKTISRNKHKNVWMLLECSGHRG